MQQMEEKTRNRAFAFFALVFLRAPMLFFSFALAGVKKAPVPTSDS
jgi:hypothetical protein